MSLFSLGDFVLHSGGRSRYVIDCDALTDADLACLAVMLAERVEPFGAVYGIPRGGLRVAEALRAHASPDCDRILIVDDVYTTGSILHEALRAFGPRAAGAVLFARGPVPPGVTALFTLAPPRAERLG